MRYLIDTSSLSRAIRDDSSRLSRIVLHLGVDQVVISVIEAVGHPIGIIDTMLAAQALVRGLTVVTDNAKEFGRIAELRVVEL